MFNLFRTKQQSESPIILPTYRTEDILTGAVSPDTKIKTIGYGANLIYIPSDLNFIWALMFRSKQDETNPLPVIGQLPSIGSSVIDLSVLDRHVKEQIPFTIEGVVEHSSNVYYFGTFGTYMNASRFYPLSADEERGLRRINNPEL